MSTRPRASALHPPALFSQVRLRSHLVTCCVVVLVGCTQWLALDQYRATERERAALAFARIVDQATVSLTQQTSLYQNALIGLRAHYLGSDTVSTAEFARYARALDIEQTVPGLRAFAFNREVRDGERAAYTGWIRRSLADYDPAYAGFEIYPDESGHDHHVVEAIFPPLGNQRSLGFDLMSSAVRRQAIERARSHGFAATQPIRLQQAPNTLAVLILAPVTTPGWNGTLSADNTVAASFLVQDFVSSSIAPTLRKRFFLKIVDLGPDDARDAEPIVLFEDEGSNAIELEQSRRDTLHRVHLFGGRRWDIRFSAREADRALVPLPAILALMATITLIAAAAAHLAQQRIRRNARNHALVSQTSDCVLEIDSTGIVTRADASALRITGLSPARWTGQPLWQPMQETDAGMVEDEFRALIAEGLPRVLTCQIVSEDATPRWIEIRLGNCLKRRAVRAVLAQISDIGPRKQAEAEIARLAFFDPLTELPNRRLLEQRAELTFSNARRQRGRAAVLVIDLDGFKQINDNAGHAIGDAVLARVASRLQFALRDSDTVARLGGDEFVVLLGQPANEVDVRAAANRLSRDLALPLNVEGRNWFVTASIGMAMYPDHGTNFAELLSKADAAMYRAKRSGSGLSSMA